VSLAFFLFKDQAFPIFPSFLFKKSALPDLSVLPVQKLRILLFFTRINVRVCVDAT